MSICENYPKPALDCAMNFLSTHDTERGITAIAGEPANGRDRYWQSKRMIPATALMMPCAACCCLRPCCTPCRRACV